MSTDESLSDEEVLAKIEEIVAEPFFRSENEDLQNSYRIILAACMLGTTNADKLARFLGLNRDKCVRPRAKLLRENGIFLEDGKVGVDEDAFEGEDDHRLNVWLMLAGLCAEGVIHRTCEVQSEAPSNVEGV